MNDLHIDLHSFEYKDEDVIDEQAITEAGDDVREWSMSDVVFLSIEGITDENFLSYMYEELEEQVIVDDIQTQPYNYLTTFAQVVMDVPSVLMELNEGSAPSYPAVAKAVARAVAEYLGLDLLPLHELSDDEIDSCGTRGPPPHAYSVLDVIEHIACQRDGHFLL